ncbi:MAG TPA: NfeD family protein [Anaerolineales bacterium]|nr:NfeD family protein [Anaerolineales bacterium]
MIDLLLTPDVAYLFIVTGLMLVVMALLTPGTGFFELGAFFALAVAGWQTYTLETNGWALGVALAGFLLFVLAFRPSRYRPILLGGSIAGLVIGSAYLFRGEGLVPGVNPWLALAMSVLSAGFLWIVATKSLDIHLRLPTHDLSRLIGAVGVARTVVHTEGTVFVNMEDWSAQSTDPIEAGQRVRVIRREGLLLEVEAVESEE